MNISGSTLMVKSIRRINILLILLIVSLSSCKNKPKEKSDEELRQMALKICENNIILDSHIDWPEFILDNPEDISRQTVKGDFDGVGPSKPSDVPDVSGYPVIVFELLKRGYTENDIKKIFSGNFLRVWNDVIEIADSLNRGSAGS